MGSGLDVSGETLEELLVAARPVRLVRLRHQVVQLLLGPLDSAQKTVLPGFPAGAASRQQLLLRATRTKRC